MLRVLMKRREMIMSQIVNQERYCCTKARTAKLEALQARLVLTKRYHQDFQDVDMEICTRSTDQQSLMDEFEEVFCYVVAELNCCITLRTAEVNTHVLYLPRANFPKFNGNYEMWKQFEFIYTIVIHNNKVLSNKTKFQLLIELLANEPRSLIADIFLSDANYNDAWLQIKNYYNSPRLIVNMVVRNLLCQPCIKSGDAAQLKQLVEVTEGTIRSLSSLGSGAQSRDPWLIGILIQKLDVFTQKMWFTELKHLNSPTFTDFMRFLNVRIQMLMGYRYMQAPGIGNVRNCTNVYGSYQRRVIPSIILTEAQASRSRRSSSASDCKASQNNSPSKNQQKQLRPATTGSELSQCNYQLNEKQAIELYEFENPSAKSTCAIKKVIDKNTGSSEFLV